MGWLPEEMLLIIDVQQFLRDDKLGHGDPYLVTRQNNKSNRFPVVDHGNAGDHEGSPLQSLRGP